MSVPSPLAFAELLSPLLIGVMLACPLYGVSVAQAISCYRTYPEDPRYVKVFVGALIILDGAHTFSLADAAKVWYFRAQPTLVYPKGLPTSLFFAYITMSLVQSAYTVRVYHLSGKKKLITAVLAFCSFVQFVSGIGMSTSQAIGGSASSVYNIASETLGAMELASGMACDILISISLVYFLNSSRSGVRRTENIIDRLIIYFIGIGLVTSILALLNLVTWLSMPNNLIFTAFHSVLSKFYVNSFLVTLNSRTSFRRNLNAHGYYNESTLVNTTGDMGLSAFQAS